MDDRAQAMLAALGIMAGSDFEASEPRGHHDLVADARALALRLPVLRVGRERTLATPSGTAAWRRSLFSVDEGVRDVVIAVNHTDEAVDIGLLGTRLLSSVGGDERFTGALLAFEAVVVRDETS